VSQLKVIELLVYKTARQLRNSILHLFRSSLSLDVLEEHRYWNRNEVLDGKWRCNRQISEGDEICLLGVEIDEAPNAVCVSVESKEDLIVASIDNCVVTRHPRLEDDRLLLEYFPLVL